MAAADESFSCYFCFQQKGFHWDDIESLFHEDLECSSSRYHPNENPSVENKFDLYIAVTYLLLIEIFLFPS